MRQDAGQVRSLETAFPFGCVPRTPVGKVFVTLSLELVPAVITGLRVCNEEINHMSLNGRETLARFMQANGFLGQRFKKNKCKQ